MRRRTFEEMITYFNQTVSEMDIDRKYKMTLLGIVTALLQKHGEDVAQIVRCKDCKHFKRNISCVGGFYDGCDELIDDGNEMHVDENFYCGYAERRTDEVKKCDTCKHVKDQWFLKCADCFDYELWESKE